MIGTSPVPNVIANTNSYASLEFEMSAVPRVTSDNDLLMPVSVCVMMLKCGYVMQGQPQHVVNWAEERRRDLLDVALG